MVSFSNRDIGAQVVIATISGDKVICSAHSHELPSYGLETGLTNYPAAYCVGLLSANRCASKFGLSALYGLSTVHDEDLSSRSLNRSPRPFKLILDTGLKRTSTGSKVFAVLKGAIDGGIKIPHNEKRFVGYDALTKKYEANSTKNYIYGSHISDHMNDLKEEEPTRFRSQFRSYINLQIKPEELSQLYEKVHNSVRKKSLSERKLRSKTHFFSNLRTLKHTYEERKENLRKKLVSLVAL